MGVYVMSKIYKILLVSATSFCCCGYFNGVAAETGTLRLQAENLSQTAASYQIAKSVFLPDTKDDLGFSGRDSSSGDYNRGDPCLNYPINGSCPDHGRCSKCPTANKWRLDSCASGYNISGNTCVPANCSVINSGYKDEIPADNICTQTTESGLTCYKDCKSVSCSGYTLDCSTVSGLSYVSAYKECPDCQNANSNCSPRKCKITECSNNKKVNDAGTACVDKDDTCPNGYYKSCETGTQGDPEYTEAGTACYQCKPQTPATCAEWVKANQSGYTVYDGSKSSLSAGNIAVLSSGTISIANGGTFTFVGPNFFAADVCQNQSTPTLTITNPTQGFVNAKNVNLNFDVDMSQYSSRTAAVEPSGSGNMVIKDATVKATGGVFRVIPSQTLSLEGTSGISTSCTYKTDYGCRAIFSGSGSSQHAGVTVASGANVSVNGSLYLYSSRLTVNSGATLNISGVNGEALFVNQSGYTPTYYASNGVHNYGTIKTSQLYTHAGQINCYSGSAFSVPSLSTSSGYPGRIKYEANSSIQIGGTCRKPTSAGEYKFTSSVSSNPLSGNSCSI